MSEFECMVAACIGAGFGLWMDPADVTGLLEYGLWL